MPVGQAEGDPQADQGDRALAAAEATQAGGRQAGDGRLAGADVDHLADPLAGGGVAAVAEAEQQQLHAGLEHLADRPSGEAHTVRGPSGMGSWYYFGKLKDPLEGLVPGPTGSTPCPGAPN